MEGRRKAVVWALVVAVLGVLFVVGSLRGVDRAGDPEVYDRIESLSDCDAVQAEFDTAAANNAREAPAGIFVATVAEPYCFRY